MRPPFASFLQWIKFLDGENSEVRNEVFGRFLKLQFTVSGSVSPRSEQLNRECSLSTDNGDYVIVGSAAFVPCPRSHTFWSAMSPDPREEDCSHRWHSSFCPSKQGHGQGLYFKRTPWPWCLCSTRLSTFSGLTARKKLCPTFSRPLARTGCPGSACTAPTRKPPSTCCNSKWNQL